MNTERLRRLARRPPRYVARRAFDEGRRELLRVELSRAARRRGRLTAERLLPAPAAEVAQSTAARAATLLAAGEAAGATRSQARLLERLDARARPALERRIEVFGDGAVPAGIPPRWNEDIRSGLGWSLGYHRRLDYRNPGRASDVKVAWELSRLRHLVTLAQLVAVQEHEEARDAIDRDLSDWIARNPMGWSVNWTCGMEVALRAVNLICVDAIVSSTGRPLRERRALVSSLYQHGWFLARHLEISDVNGNHYVADAVGLVWLARYFEGVGESRRWLRTGLDMLSRAAAEQVLDDGLDHEGSLPYHVLVLEMLLTARHAAGPALSGIDGVLRGMLDALATLAGPAGRVPNLGDDDGGRVLGLAGTASRDARRVLALGAALTGHEAAGRRGGQAEPEDVLWLLGPSALAALPERDEGRAGAPAHLRAGGLVVLGRGEDHVAVDVGAIGFRGRGGHGHLDAMSFEATLGGRLAVRDSGTASYTGDPGLRNRLRDAPAHSVVLVDGRRYARIGGEEALWSVEGDAPPEVVSVEGDRDSQKATVVQRLPAAGGVALHERTIEWRPGHVRMLDRLEAPEGAAVSAFLHLPAGCEPTAAGFRGGHHDYAAHPPEGASMTAEPHPWSEAYGTVGEGLRVTLEFRASGEVVEWSWDVRAR